MTVDRAARPARSRRLSTGLVVLAALGVLAAACSAGPDDPSHGVGATGTPAGPLPRGTAAAARTPAAGGRPSTAAAGGRSSTGDPVPRPSTSRPDELARYFAGTFSTAGRQWFKEEMVAFGDDPQVGRFVRVLYPAGATAPSSGHPGGAQIMVPFAAGPVDDATLSYRLRFPTGFTWVKGGKLPGLCGGDCNTGGTDPSQDSGWSARFMWRAEGAGQVYAYLPVTQGYGSELGTGRWFFPADGAWHTLTEQVHLNAPGGADGFISVRWDGAEVYRAAGLTFRSGAGLRIDGLLFSTFFGGHDSSWAPDTDQTADFAAFRVGFGR